MTSFITPHCISVFVVRHTPEGPRYLLIRRCGKYLPGTWQMVTGGVDEGETAPQAVFREIKEETGLEPAEAYSADAVETFYMMSKDKVTFVPVFIAFVDCEKVTLAPKEHDAYEWLEVKAARKRLVWAEQRRIIDHVHENCVLHRPHDLLRIHKGI